MESVVRSVYHVDSAKDIQTWTTIGGALFLPGKDRKILILSRAIRKIRALARVLLKDANGSANVKVDENTPTFLNHFLGNQSIDECVLLKVSSNENLYLIGQIARICQAKHVWEGQGIS